MSASPADLNDRVILLTGASQGIGAVTAPMLVRRGARLLAHHRGQPDDAVGLAAVIDPLPRERVATLAADYTDDAAVDRLWADAVSVHGHVDTLVLNAAMMEPTGGVDCDADAWDRSWALHHQVNTQAPARLMRAAVRHFRARGGGVIVLLSSWVAQRGASNPAMLPYAASKAAIKAVAQSIARAYAAEGVLVYIIAPGIVRTRMSVDFAALQGGEDSVTQSLAMREWVPPEEVAELIAFLASGTVRHLNGATLDLNGATYIR